LESKKTSSPEHTTLIILGNVQDGGSPHIGCEKKCCIELFNNPDKNRMVVSLGIVDPTEKKTWIIEATPDYPRQAKILKDLGGYNKKSNPDGIFLTHAHIGHYAGLMYLGKESMNSSNIPVYAMTRMKGFLIKNGPWSQLIKLSNIKLKNIDHLQTMKLSKDISITPFLVPHRDEFSETVGYRINGPTKTALFIPDIDKWNKWNKSIIDEIKKVDFAFIDATFYDEKEINNRDITEIPHPFVIETMELFNEFSLQEKEKIHFIHMNHTNPLLDTSSLESEFVLSKGFNIARALQSFSL
jgi:pyrroloquinoline quinone biosynthesis protein B